MHFMGQHFKKNGSFYCVILIITFHFVNNYIWCSNDYLTIEDDMCTHLETHLFFYSQIKNSLDSGLGMGNVIRTISELLKNSPILYPPLVYLISSFVNSILGTGHLVVTRLTQMIYFAILISSVYEIGKICFDKKSVIIAALLVSFYPGIVGASRLYTLDLPLTSFTALAIYCLIKTKYFSNFKRSIIFGVILGVGIMIKGQILFFVIGPLVYIFFKSFFKMGKNKSEKLICGRNYILALVISGIGSSLWWWPRFNLLLDRFMFLLFEVSENPLVPVMKLDVLSVNWLFSYVYFSLNNVSPVLFGLFLLGLLSSLKAQFEYKGIIISWILGSYYILSMFSMKIDRFFMPAFPAIAIITIVFFYSIKNIVFQRALLAATVGFAVFQAMFLSYYPKSHDITVAAQRNSIFYFITPMHDPEILGKKKPDKKNFFESPCINPHNSNINIVTANLFKDLDTSLTNKTVNLGIAIDDQAWHTAFYLKYALKAKDPKMKIFHLSKNNYRPALIEMDKQGHFYLKKDKYDYLIALVNESVVECDSKVIKIDALKNLLGGDISGIDKYSFVNNYKILPEGYNIILFKSNSKID